MGRKKKPTRGQPADDTPKNTRKMIAIRDTFSPLVDQLVERFGFRDRTEYVNQLIRRDLEANGLWPTQQPPSNP